MQLALWYHLKIQHFDLSTSGWGGVKIYLQLNVLYWFRGIFDIKEKEIMYNTFILSNFNYYPIVWHFCGKTASKKVKNIQERALCFMFSYKVSTYESLLDRCGYTTLHIRRIKTIANEVLVCPWSQSYIYERNVQHKRNIIWS